MSTFKVFDREIGPSAQPFIIAEMSGNHNQSLEQALKIVDAAHKSGADALKIQTYTPDTMTLDVSRDEFLVKDKKDNWNNRSLYQIYAEAHTPWEWHKAIYERCKELGLICFSTPFDETSVDFLESLGNPIYKIASFECNDVKLISYVAKTGKPLIMSTGMASLAEIDESVKTARKYGAKDIILLKCTSSYPADPKNANLLTIPHLRQAFDVNVGLSDHTLGCGVAVAATALGACVIEKHFTIDRSEGGVDSAFSMEPAEFKAMVEEVNRAWHALGKVTYSPTEEDLKSIPYRRSLYISQDLKKGDILSTENLKAVRPGRGLPTKYFETAIGKALKMDAPKGTPLTWDLI